MISNLKDFGFMDGVLVVWQQSDDVVAVNLLRFSGSTGAVGWFRSAAQVSTVANAVDHDHLANVGPAVTNRTVEFTYEDGSHALVGLFAAGQSGVDIQTWNGTLYPNDELLQDLAEQQYQRLPPCNCIFP